MLPFKLASGAMWVVMVDLWERAKNIQEYYKIQQYIYIYILYVSILYTYNYLYKKDVKWKKHTPGYDKSTQLFVV
jgi:hypothetical protein